MPKKVLVVRKTTSLDLHGEVVRKKVQDGLLDSSYLDNLKKAHSEHQSTLENLHDLLDRYRIEYYDVGQKTYWPDLSKFDCIMTVGGDGTLLKASHHIDEEDIPVVGIKSSTTSVGHLCGVDSDGIEDMIKSLLDDQLPSKLIHRIKAEIHLIESDTRVFTEPVLNDFLYCNENPAGMSKYSLIINGSEEYQKSSGIWIATAAGSTAGIAAAGGTRVDIGTDKIQYRIREPFQNGYQLVGDFVEARKGSFEIENMTPNAMLALDGQPGQIRLGIGDKIKFFEASPLCLVV